MLLVEYTDGCGNKQIDESFFDKEVTSRCSERTKQVSTVKLMAAEFDKPFQAQLVWVNTVDISQYTFLTGFG